NLAEGGGQIPHHPQWPSILWNMTSFLCGQRPGPDRNNCSCGERVTLRLPATEDTAVLRINQKPAQTIRMAQPGGLAVTAPLEAGVLDITSGKHQWTVAINPASATESDLRHAQTSSLAAKPATSSSRRLLSPLCFLLALLLLATIPRIS
ncbi:MAG: hypothetical protein IJJ33_00510, partial [Victivallales bacterium]|nr:hypothetical protein [Victivallales bacterium]